MESHRSSPESFVTLVPVDEFIATVSAVNAALVLVVVYMSLATVEYIAPACACEYITLAPVGFIAFAPVEECNTIVPVDAAAAWVAESSMLAPVGNATPERVGEYTDLVSAADAALALVVESIAFAPVVHTVPNPLLNILPRCQPCLPDQHTSLSTSLKLPQCLHPNLPMSTLRLRLQRTMNLPVSWSAKLRCQRMQCLRLLLNASPRR